MRRQVSTALSVIALLAVGTAAAAVNVRMLHDAGTKSAQFQMHAMGRDTSTSVGSEGPLGQPGNSVSPLDPAGPGGFGSGGGPMGPGDGLYGFGPGDDDRPQLTAAQMMLLRVSAMVRADPETVRAAARGYNTDPATVGAVKQAAQAVGVTLKDLAAVKALPPLRDRGHGGPGDDDHHRFGPDGSIAKTYDD